MDDEHLVRHASFHPEAALALREVFFSNGWHKSVKYDCGKYFASDGE